MTVGMQGAEQVAPGGKLIAAQITSDVGFLLAQGAAAEGALGPHGVVPVPTDTCGPARTGPCANGSFYGCQAWQVVGVAALSVR
jgi:hypothetical protein